MKVLLKFQGDLNSVVRDSFAITKLIERISGSDEYKEEYDNLLSQKEKIDTTTTDTYAEKKKKTNEKNETISARKVSNEIHFYNGKHYNTIAKKLRIEDVQQFSISPDKVCFLFFFFIFGALLNQTKKEKFSFFFFYYFSIRK